MKTEYKVVGSNLNDSVESRKAEFMERIELNRKYNPSKLILEKRELLEEKKGELQEKINIMYNELKCLYGKKGILEIIDLIYERYDKEEKNNNSLKIKRRKEYSEDDLEGKFFTKWDRNPSFAVVIQIFSIYYEFSINCKNIAKFLELEDCLETPDVCGIKISTLDRYNRGETSNETLLILAALLFVVNSENENRKELEIFPRLNENIDRDLYNNLESKIDKVEFIFEFYRKTSQRVDDFVKESKYQEITILDEEILAFVYITKREIEEWEKFEIEKEKYNTVCKVIFYGNGRSYAKLIDGYENKIKSFQAKNKEQLKNIHKKIECYENKGYKKIKTEICEACALYCSHYKRNRDLEDEYCEEREMEHQIREEKEFIARIKEELMKYEVSTRNNVIRNLEFISSYIDEKMFLLINNYGNLNEQGQKEYLLFIDCLMQQLDKDYSYQSFCEKQEKIIDIKEADILLEQMSWQQLYTTLDIMISSTLQIFSREDWYVFSSIGIVKMKYNENVMKQVYYGVEVFKIQQRYLYQNN